MKTNRSTTIIGDILPTSENDNKNDKDDDDKDD